MKRRTIFIDDETWEKAKELAPLKPERDVSKYTREALREKNKKESVGKRVGHKSYKNDKKLENIGDS